MSTPKAVEAIAVTCSIPCDPDCDAVCHGDHEPGHKKTHWPWDCPAADRYDWGSSFNDHAVKRLRGERDDARDEHNGCLARLVESENALAILLIREGGQTEITVAEQASLPRCAWFVRSPNRATGGTVLAWKGEQRNDGTPGCLCPHTDQPDGRLVRDGVLALGCPVHDPDAGGDDA